MTEADAPPRDPPDAPGDAAADTGGAGGGPGGAVPFGEALRVWARVALLSFGGPAGQIAVVHRIVVDEKRWISERRFLHALNYCMLLPGPEAMQLVTYIGWLLNRTLGGIVAGALFVAPGFLAILALSVLYAQHFDSAAVQGVFYGVKPAVLAIVVHAVIRIGRRALHNRVMVGVAAGAFVGIFFFGVPFPLLIAAAALLGFVGGRVLPSVFHATDHGNASAAAPAPVVPESALTSVRPSLGRAVRTVAVWGGLWWAPTLALAWWLGWKNVFVQQGVFFSQTAVVTFGGAYAVLAYVAQRAVEVFGWLAPGEMLDGLAMAETTPGPLIQVLQFVGFMGAQRDPGALDPVLAGVLASVLATWTTFIPCFLWIFLGAPYIERLRENRTLNAAMSTITAAVVGVVLNLGVWFALHVVFAEVGTRRIGPLRLYVPEWSGVDVIALLIGAGAFVAIFRFKRGMLTVLGVCAAVGLIAVTLLGV
ncbi:MAG: chromate efflux transporter [Phycisphaerales bacterium]|nr:MAG: chromate efflux transporter [Phycisphaerales bacterium]